jgi:hypothetical protein
MCKCKRCQAANKCSSWVSPLVAQHIGIDDHGPQVLALSHHRRLPGRDCYGHEPHKQAKGVNQALV